LLPLTDVLGFRKDSQPAERSEVFDEKSLATQSEGIIIDPDPLRFWTTQYITQCPNLDKYLKLHQKERDAYLLKCDQRGTYADSLQWTATQELLEKYLLFYREENDTASMKFISGSGTKDSLLIKAILYDPGIRHYVPLFADSLTNEMTRALKHFSPGSLCLNIRDNFGNPWIAVSPRAKNGRPVGDCLFLALALTETLAGLVMEAKYKKHGQLRAVEEHPEGIPYGLPYSNQNCHMAVALGALNAGLVLPGVSLTDTEDSSDTLEAPERASELLSVLRQLKEGPLSDQALSTVRGLINFLYQEVGRQQDFGETLLLLYRLVYSKQSEVELRQSFTCMTCKREWGTDRRCTNLIQFDLPQGEACDFQQLVTDWCRHENLVDLQCCTEGNSPVATRTDLVVLPDTIAFALGRNVIGRNNTRISLKQEFQVVDIINAELPFEVVMVVFHSGGLYGHFTHLTKNCRTGDWYYYDGSTIKKEDFAIVQQRSDDIVYVGGRKPSLPSASNPSGMPVLPSTNGLNIKPNVTAESEPDSELQPKARNVLVENRPKLAIDPSGKPAQPTTNGVPKVPGATSESGTNPTGILFDSGPKLVIDDGLINDFMKSTTSHPRVKFPVFALQVLARLLKQFLLYNELALQVPLNPWWGAITNRFESLSRLSLDDPKMIATWLPTVPIMFPGVEIQTYIRIDKTVVKSSVYSCPDSAHLKTFLLLQLNPDGQYFPMVVPKKGPAPPNCLTVIGEETKDIVFLVIPPLANTFITLGSLLFIEAYSRKIGDKVGVIPIAEPESYTPPRISCPKKAVPGISENYWLCKILLSLICNERSTLYRTGDKCTSIEQNLANYWVIFRTAEIFFDLTPDHLHLVLGCGRGRALILLSVIANSDLIVLGIERNDDTVKECYRMLWDIQTNSKGIQGEKYPDFSRVLPWTKPKMTAFKCDSDQITSLSGVTSASRFVGGKKKDDEVTEEFKRVSKLLLGEKGLFFFWCYALREQALGKLDVDTKNWRLITLENMAEEGSKFNATLFINMNQVLGPVTKRSKVTPILRDPFKAAQLRPAGVGPSPKKATKDTLRQEPKTTTFFSPPSHEPRVREDTKRSLAVELRAEPSELFKSPRPPKKPREKKPEKSSKSPSLQSPVSQSPGSQSPGSQSSSDFQSPRPKRRKRDVTSLAGILFDQDLPQSEQFDDPAVTPAGKLPVLNSSPAGTPTGKLPVLAPSPAGTPGDNTPAVPVREHLDRSPIAADQSSVLLLQDQIHDLRTQLKNHVEKQVSGSSTDDVRTIQFQMQELQTLLRSKSSNNPADCSLGSTDLVFMKKQLEDIQVTLVRKRNDEVLELLKTVATKDDIKSSVEQARIVGLQGAVTDLRLDAAHVMRTLKEGKEDRLLMGELMKIMVQKDNSPKTFQPQPYFLPQQVATGVESLNVSQTRSHERVSSSRTSSRFRSSSRESRPARRSRDRGRRKSRSRSRSKGRGHDSHARSRSSSRKSRPARRSSDRGRRKSRSRSRSKGRGHDSRSARRSRDRGRKKSRSRSQSRGQDTKRYRSRGRYEQSHDQSQHSRESPDYQGRSNRGIPKQSYSNGFHPLTGAALNDWSCSDVSAWLQERHMPTMVVAKFTEAQISGAMVSTLSNHYLQTTLRMEEAHISAFRLALQCAMNRKR